MHDAAGDKTIIVHDAGDGPIISGGRIPTIETYWLNDSLFLYAAHKIGAIDRSDFDSSELSYLKFYSTITLHQLNINTKEDKVFFVLDSVKQGNMNGRFFKDKIGQTVYSTSGFDSYLIDTDRKTFLDYPFYELGNGFSVANKSDSGKNLIRYHGKEIGKTNPSVVHVSKGIIALDQNSKAISVWSAVTGEWSTIKIPWISSVVGWIDEE